MTATKPKTKTKTKAPTLAEMKRVVRAWVKANWPDAKHVELLKNERAGCSTVSLDLIGPPTDEPWHTNDLPMPPSTPMDREELQRRIEELDRDLAELNERRKTAEGGAA